MSDPHSAQDATADGTVSVDQARIIGRFRSAWQAARAGAAAPQIERFLDGTADDERAVLRVELARIDQEFRSSPANPDSTMAEVAAPDASAVTTTTAPETETDPNAKRNSSPADVGATLDAPGDASRSTPSETSQSIDELAATIDASALKRSPGSKANSVSFSLANLPDGDIPEGEGPLVAGYEVLGVLGRGAMGVVYKARQRGLRRIVALKMILAGGHASELELSRFRTEAEAVGQLQHPNIVQVYEVGEQDGCPYLSLEYVNGGSLQGKLGGNPQPVMPAAQLMQVLAQAMDFAHAQGIIHRDLKPANVMLMASRAAVSGSMSDTAVTSALLVEQTYGIPKITDFGLAKRVEEESSQTRSGAILGTPSYMAPEQAEGLSKDVGPLADQYALGAMLYELLTGRPPFRGATIWETLDQVRTQEPVPPSRLQPKVPRDLETICLKALQKDPLKRYLNCGAMAEDLRRFVSGEPILARPVSGVERLWRWCRRHPGIALLSGAVAALLVAVAVGSTVFAFQLAHEKDLALKAEHRAEVNEELAKVNEGHAKAAEKVAKANEVKAVAAQKVAGEQARLALGTIYDVVTTADEKLRSKPDMGPLRKQLLQLVMSRLDKISGDAVTSGKADRTMGVALQRMGLFYNSLGNTPDEVKVYKRSLVIFNRLMQEQPEDDWVPFDAAISYDALGEVGREIEPDPAKLFDPYLKSLELKRPLVSRPPKDGLSMLKRQLELVSSYVKLGVLSLVVGDPARAEEYGREGVRQGKAVVATLPADKAALRQSLSGAYLVLAEAELHVGHEAEARADYRRGEQLRAESVQADATDALAKQELARAVAGIGDLEMETHHPTAAIQRYRDAHDRFAQLAAKDPSNPEALWYRANSEYSLAIALATQGDMDAARVLYETCLKARRKLLAADPQNPQRKIELMLVLARLGHDKEAAGMAHDIMIYAPRHPGMLFRAACTYALCSATAKEPAQKAEYLSRSADAFRQAAAHGYRDSWELANSPDLEPLRKSPAFRTVHIGAQPRQGT